MLAAPLTFSAGPDVEDPALATSLLPLFLIITIITIILFFRSLHLDN